jgi:5-(carboxyamino)imidazole ribonucleotide mutase
MPTIKPEMIVPYVMMENILAKGDNTDFLLKKYKNFHWYNKNYLNFYKPLRKIGHITNKLSFQNIPYPLIYIVMGSSSDLPTVQPAIDLLNKYKIPIKVDVVSAHRSPEWMFEFGKNIESWCGKVIIAAAGGAAHLPGMLASLTPIPVIGIPVPSKYLGGKDSLLSIVEMPEGVPVATVGIGKAKNAGILALKIIGAIDEVKDIIIENKKKVDNQRKTL